MADTHTTHLISIQQLLAQGKAGEALSELQVLLSRNPEHGRAQALYGHILLNHLVDYSAAEEAFRIALRHAPTYPALYYDYGELLLRLDKGTELIAVLNKSLEVPGVEKDKVYRLFGMLYERESKWEDAISYYTKALLYALSDINVAAYRNDVIRVQGKMNL